MNAKIISKDLKDELAKEENAVTLPVRKHFETDTHPGAIKPVVADSASQKWHNLDNRLSMIAEAAYFKAEKRGFEVGHEVSDWLEAEQELAKIMGEA